MKKKILLLITTSFLLFATTITAFAKELSESANNGFINILKSFAGSSAAITGATVFVAVLLFFVFFRKKLTNRLNDSTASLLTNMFILFFAINGIACLAMAFATDGETWSNLMHVNPSPTRKIAQFEDYILNLQYSGSQSFHKNAETLTPFSQIIYLILAQFLPSKHIFNSLIVTYPVILRNQTFMYLYLLLTMVAIVLLYRLNRSVLRNNHLNMRDEVVSFLLVVSYPTIYCVEKGNIALFSLVLVLTFIIYHNANKHLIKELCYIALAVSAAITPYTIIFALLLLKEKNKKAILNIARTILYFLIISISPAVFTGFSNLLTYIKTFVSVSANNFVPGNMSIANLLLFFGISNSFVIYTVMILTGIIAIIAMIKLPEMWQKTAAAVYIILNIFSVSDAVAAIFVFIPFVFLLAQKEHKAADWLYMLSFACLITPFPEWFRFDSEKFNLFLESLGIVNIRNANNLIALAATQFILFMLLSQLIPILKKKFNKQRDTEQPHTKKIEN